MRSLRIDKKHGIVYLTFKHRGKITIHKVLTTDEFRQVWFWLFDDYAEDFI